MLDLFRNRFTEGDMILDASLDNRHIDRFISVASKAPLKRDTPQHRPPKYPSTCYHCKVAAPSYIALIYDRIMAALAFCLTLPVLSLLTLIALVDTTKRRWALKQCDLSQVSSHQAVDMNEKITQDELYYARRWGYDCHRHKVTTKDGYILNLYRFSQKRNLQGMAPRRGHPVLIGHGLFQCSGNLVLNENDSLVFALVDEGYDVFTGNNRSVDSLEHHCLSSNDASYWDWGLKELALYDLPAMLDYIRDITGHEKVGYIGHSQGNAQAFIALSLQPELANKMSCFIALAPAIVSGPLATSFPLRALIYMNKTVFRILFGNKAFLEIMTLAQRYLPPSVMCHLAFSVFSYLFQWGDQNWVHRRKIKYFQFSPRPVSTRLVSDWLEGWGRHGVCLHVSHNKRTTTETIPLVIIYGGNDFLVDGAAFVRSFEGYEHHGLMDKHQLHLPHAFCFPSLNLTHVECIPAYEHMDTIWAHDSTSTTHPVILQALKSAKWKMAIA